MIVFKKTKKKKKKLHYLIHSLPWLWLGVCVNSVSSLEENALVFSCCLVWGEAVQLVVGAVGFAGDLSIRAVSLCGIVISTFSLHWESCRLGKSQ